MYILCYILSHCGLPQDTLCSFLYYTMSFPGGSEVKASACNAGDPVWSLGWEDPLEKEMATHSSILAWRIPWTEEPGGLQFTGSQRVGHDWATSLSLYYTIRPFCLSILYIIFYFASVIPKLTIDLFPTPSPLWQPQVCSLCLWVYFIDKLICVIV